MFTALLKNNIFYNEFTEILVNFFKLFHIELTEIDKVSSYLFNLSFLPCLLLQIK